MTEKNTGKQSILFRQASHVDNLFHTLESEKEKPMNVISGTKLLGLYGKLDRPMSFAKMFLVSFQWTMAQHLTKYYLTWKVKGIKSNRFLFQLAVKKRGTEESGFGFLLTPSTVQPTSSEERRKKRKEYRASVGRKDSPGSLAEQVTGGFLPTPREAMSRGNCNNDRKKGNIEDWVAKYNSTGKESLNPNWVEWLMNFPVGWTDLNIDDPKMYDIEFEPDIPRVVVGMKGRAARLKQMGNAIVPSVAQEIFKAIKIHKLSNTT